MKMKQELQSAWQDYCASAQERVDQQSFNAGWEACLVHAARSIDEIAYIGRQMAQGVPQADVEASLRSSADHAA
jgi:hypothetical protein